MLNAKEASELLKSMTPEDRFEALKNEVSKKTQNALEKEIKKIIASCRDKVEMSLGSNVCIDPDVKIRDLLIGLGYQDVNVTSDFPGYNENYEGSTTIKFSIPK